MRGALAIDELLSRRRDAPLAVFIIWEPVLMTDLGPPSTRVLSKAADNRVSQWWDSGRMLSAEIVRAALATPDAWRTREAGREIYPDTVVWDAVLLFRAGARWDSSLPPPAFSGFPVVDATGGLEAVLYGSTAGGSE